MRILVTNDDGIGAAGLATLARLAAETSQEVTVAAPSGERSGSAASLSMVDAEGKHVIRRVQFDAAPTAVTFSVEASPAQIVILAMESEFGPPPELVLSGINHGPNTGSAVLHSGTVGAAFTAAARGLPALAFSQLGEEPHQWETAADVTRRLLVWGARHAPRGVVINVNIPDVPPDRLRGLRQARLAIFGATQAQVTTVSHTETVTVSTHEETQQPDSDAALLDEGWATITALIAPCEVHSDFSELFQPDAVTRD